MNLVNEKEEKWDKLNLEELSLSDKRSDLIYEKVHLQEFVEDTYHLKDHSFRILQDSLGFLQGSRYESTFYNFYLESQHDFKETLEEFEEKLKKITQQTRVVEDRIDEIYYEKLSLSNS